MLLVGYPPFYGKAKKEVFAKIEKGSYVLNGTTKINDPILMN